MRILIKNATIVTMEDENKVIPHGNVYIQDKYIVKVTPELDPEFKADKVIDANGNVLMPGLINCHTHIAMTMLRNHADDVNLEDWLFNNIFPIESKMTPKDVYYGAKLGMLEMISSGTTTFLDMYFYEDQVARAASEVNIRAYLGIGITKDSLERNLKETKELYTQYKDNDLIQSVVAPHSVYTNDESDLVACGNLHKELKNLHTIHLNESKAEVQNAIAKYGMNSLQEAYKTGNLTSQTVVGHGVHLTDADIKLIKEVGCSIAHNPCSNLKLASGVLPVSKLLAEGINVCLGTDGAASNNNLDMFEEMKFASLIQKGVYDNPTNLPAWETLKMATVNGAKALHMEESLGKVKAGYLADLILVDIHNINHTPSANVINSLVYSTNSKDVYTTIINGKIVYEDHRFKTADANELMKQVNAVYHELIK
ncbi:amidohydrolase [Mycoplasma sp. VS509_3]|uniref:amidohydrolase n=1 Tax=unclassified Mycoplasma TaxID=2683645 RepID=UPI003AAF09CA